jgi:YHS domain-containing protein
VILITEPPVTRRRARPQRHLEAVRMVRSMLMSVSLLSAMVAIAAAQSMPSGHGPEIGGYCPVAYSVAGKPMKGDPRFSSVYEGRTYWFVSADAKKLFDANPGKHRIAFGGWCATGVAHNVLHEANPMLFSIVDGVTYLFSNAEAKAMFDKEVGGSVATGHANWKGLASKAMKK